MKRTALPWSFALCLFSLPALHAQSVSTEGLAARAAKQPMRGAAGSMSYTPSASGVKSALPLRRIVLYKNGVAYFERSGFVTGDALIHIDFTSAQLNDLLRSLNATDLGGGQIAGWSFDSAQPFANLHLGSDPTVDEFLNAMKGKQVQVHGNGPDVTGKLLNVEIKQVTNPRTGDRSEHRFVSVVTDSGALRTVELTPLVEVRTLDDAERQDIAQYLRLLSTTHDPPMRHLTLETRGTGRREIRIGYLGAVPPWKSNYRIASAGGQTTVEELAVVENPSDVDWDNVPLTLVSGAPGTGAAARGFDPASSTGPVTQPTTIRHNESAMVPILKAKLDAEPITAWFNLNHANGAQHSLWVRNSGTGTMDAGSFTFLEDGIFAGQGELPEVPPGERRFANFAADDTIKVEEHRHEPPSVVRHIAINDGTLSLHHTLFLEHIYHVTNTTPMPRTVVLGISPAPNLPRMGPWELSKETPATDVVTRGPDWTLYRFEVKLAPNAQEKVRVLEEHTHPTRLNLDKVSFDELNQALHECGDNPQVVALLEPLLDAKKKLAALDQQAHDRKKALDEVNAEERRLRDNIATLKGTAEESALNKRYSDAMLAQEDKLAALRTQADAAEADRTRTLDAMNATIHGLHAELRFPNPAAPQEEAAR